MESKRKRSLSKSPSRSRSPPPSRIKSKSPSEMGEFLNFFRLPEEIQNTIISELNDTELQNLLVTSGQVSAKLRDARDRPENFKILDIQNKLRDDLEQEKDEEKREKIFQKFIIKNYRLIYTRLNFRANLLKLLRKYMKDMYMLSLYEDLVYYFTERSTNVYINRRIFDLIPTATTEMRYPGSKTPNKTRHAEMLMTNLLALSELSKSEIETILDNLHFLKYRDNDSWPIHMNDKPYTLQDYEKRNKEQIKMLQFIEKFLKSVISNNIT